MELWPDGVSAVPFGWVSGAGLSTVSREATIVKIGTYSFKETAASGADAITTTIPWSTYYQGRKITCYGWLYASNASQIRLRIQDGVTDTHSSYHTGAAGWEFISVSATVNAAATQLVFGIVWAVTNTAYADGCGCVEGPLPVAFAEGPMTINLIRYSVGTGSRDLTAVAGDVSYTGAGFRPRAVEIHGIVAATEVASWGFADGSETADNESIGQLYDGTMTNSATFIVIAYTATGPTFSRAIAKSFDSDGITLTWSKTGSPSGTFAMKIFYYR